MSDSLLNSISNPPHVNIHLPMTLNIPRRFAIIQFLCTCFPKICIFIASTRSLVLVVFYKTVYCLVTGMSANLWKYRYTAITFSDGITKIWEFGGAGFSEICTVKYWIQCFEIILNSIAFAQFMRVHLQRCLPTLSAVF